jgi:hypothetical protein
LPEDGVASRVVGLSIIIGPELLSCFTESISIAIMPGTMMQFLYFDQSVIYLFIINDPERKRDELASFFFKKEFALFRYGQIGIGH